MYADTHVYAHVDTHVCAHFCAHVYAHVQIHVHTHIQTVPGTCWSSRRPASRRAYLCPCTCPHACLSSCLHVCIHSCLHKYLYTCEGVGSQEERQCSTISSHEARAGCLADRRRASCTHTRACKRVHARTVASILLEYVHAPTWGGMLHGTSE